MPPTSTPRGCAIALIATAALGAIAQTDPTTDPTGDPAPTNEHTAPSPGPHEAIVRLRDGRFLSGVLIEETPNAVVLEIAGVRTPIAIGRVDRLEILPPLDVRYETWRESITIEQTEEILLLAEWLRARGRFEDALAELDAALESSPNHTELRRLRKIIDQQQELSQRRIDRENTDLQQDTGHQPTKTREPLLDAEAINLIRLLEIDLENPPRISVPDDLAVRLQTTFPRRAAAERLGPNPDSIAVVQSMFDLRARNFYPEVRVQEDPPHLARYRSQVHRRWIINSCATSRCHGGKEAGRLRLAPRTADRTAVAYTNLLILNQHTLQDGRPLIDYTEPERSALLELALPINESTRPHPDIPGFRAALPSRTHPRYTAALDWIRSMHRPRPEYPIEYPPPVQPPPEPEPTPDEPEAQTDDSPALPEPVPATEPTPES